MAIILDGKATAAKIKDEIRSDVSKTVAEGKRPPCLAVILVGENPASQVYVRNKVRACETTGITSRLITMPADIASEALISRVRELNYDTTVDGILVQLPLPAHLDSRAVIEAIDPRKDVDTFHPFNTGKLFSGIDGFAPCTAAGILTLLDEYGIEIPGKHCVVLGRSNIVGKPMAMLFLQRNGTVTVCHSRTPDIAAFTKTADILVVAVGRTHLVNGSMLKSGAVVVDVGMNRENGVLTGDCDFESCEKAASFITPVPGGVGPMTIATLLQNTIRAYCELTCRN